MIGIVIVSHSAALADATRDLAQQMSPRHISIAVAGGTGDPDAPFGTNPMAIYEAIESVYTDEGVLVLMDLGSALLSAETAIEFLSPEQQPNVYLCEAPIVEGALAAAVQAAVGSSMEAVLAETRQVLIAKRDYLGVEDTIASADATISKDMTTVELRVPNPLGIHARPAAKIVGMIHQHAVNCSIEYQGRQVDGRSISSVMTLGAGQGDRVTFYVSGTGTAMFITALERFFDDNLGDRDSAAPAPTHAKPIRNDTPQSARVVTGIPAARGIAIARAYRLNASAIDVEATRIRDIVGEQSRLEKAVQAATNDLQGLFRDTRQKLGESEAGILQAHVLILQDPTLLTTVSETIQSQAQDAASAWWQNIKDMATRYRSLDDPYMQARAADVLDVGKRVLRKLEPDAVHAVSIPDDCILVATDLAPSETARLDPEQVHGIVTEQGGATSHSAIFARALGIPAVVGLGEVIRRIESDKTIAIDGETGQVWLDPDDATLNTLRRQQNEWQVAQREVNTYRFGRATTTDDRHIKVAANIGQAADATVAANAGADGVGLFRTELMFMNRTSAPTEQEQLHAYTQAAQAFEDKPVLVRTLDVGGDKPISYINIGREDNPFLGYRGIRYWLDTPDIARTQLRAIYRASAMHNVKMMMPMISTLTEILQVKALVHDVLGELEAENLPFNPDMEVGMMIEVPSAVFIADQLAPHVDFFSIGTNDLTQYILAADRGNAKTSGLVSPFQPAVVRAIHRVVEAAHRNQIWVGVCGEMAGQSRAVPLLLGLGIDELSMSAPAVAAVKALLRRLSYEDTSALATRILNAESAEDIEQQLDDYLSGY
jgi:multiphosphoryl transfer protein